MPKLSPKKKNEIILKLIAVSSIQLDTMDQLGVTDDSPMRVETEKLIYYLEDVVDTAYQNPIARNTTRLTKLIHKIDTVIRKEHE